jgi:hypothetical protein
MSRKLLAVFTLLAGGAFLSLPVQAQTNSLLTGTWEIVLQSNGSTPGPAVSGLASFIADGTMVETDGAEIFKQPFGTNTKGTPGHGAWKAGATSGQWYISFFSLILNPNGTLFARKIIAATVGINPAGSQFQGTYQQQVVNPSGTVLSSSSGSLSGQLLVRF